MRLLKHDPPFSEISVSNTPTPLGISSVFHEGVGALWIFSGTTHCGIPYHATLQYATLIMQPIALNYAT